VFERRNWFDVRMVGGSSSGHTRGATRWQAVALIPVVLLAAFALAGCGKKSSSTSTTSTTSTADWAGSVCTALITWKNAVKSAGDTITAGNVSKDAVQTAATSVSTATQTLADTLKGLGKPNTASGAQAKAALDQLSTSIASERANINAEVSNATSLAGLVAAAPKIVNSLQAMGNDVSNTFSKLQSLDTSGELQSAFEKSDACKPITNSG
jgi:hypothetical protein